MTVTTLVDGLGTSLIYAESLYLKCWTILPKEKLNTNRKDFKRELLLFLKEVCLKRFKLKSYLVDLSDVKEK